MPNEQLPEPPPITPQDELALDLISLVHGWAKLGIDPDDFVKCSRCHEYWVDEEGAPRHCQCEREEKL